MRLMGGEGEAEARGKGRGETAKLRGKQKRGEVKEGERIVQTRNREG